MAVTAAPIPPTKREQGRPRGSKNKPKPTTDANQPKRRRSAATPQRSLDDAMIQRSDIHVTTTLAASVGVTAAAASIDPELELQPDEARGQVPFSYLHVMLFYHVDLIEFSTTLSE
ncbi:Prop expression regulator [Phytophthora palmivora]|uniref:Prop expression regulator n=1 Tax=Phytophthora palmivora TaxID=4796 RepID=A0A2P4YJF8_9STRA|nr:Prop expression regulator [Phytophthora palmivora]